MYKAEVSIGDGADIKEPPDCNEEFPCRFEDALKNSMCFATDGSKREGKSFTRYALLDIKQKATEKHRTSNIESIFTAEGLARAETLNRIQNYEPGTFIFFSDLKSWIHELGGTPRIKSASYLEWDLRDKIRELELTNRRIEFFWIPAHCGIQINENTDSGDKDAINNGKDSQFLPPSSDMKAYWKGCLQEQFHAFCLETGTEKVISYFNK
jgi:hypothetical protein